MKTQLIVSCEHGGNRVPDRYAHLFRGRHRLLASHRGYDPGSLELGRALARRFKAPFFAATNTRLLVELNRSPGHPRLFSELTAVLDPADRQQLVERYYHPHRNRVESAIATSQAAGYRVLHVSVHSFTPRLNGQVRRTDIGLLYDPARPLEKQFSDQWRARLVALRPDLRVRRNYPYLGKADGFTTYLRRRLAADRYAGIELEVNQLWLLKTGAWRKLLDDVARSLAELVVAGKGQLTNP